MSFYKVEVGNKVASLEIMDENGTLVAVRRAQPKHLLRKPLAWAFSEEVINLLKEKGVDEIRVICDDTLYTCSMSKFLALAVPFDRGFGRQRHLPLQYWQKTQNREKESCRQI